MKKQYLLTLLLTLTFVGLSFGGALAQSASGSISGDSVCGQWDTANATITKKCDINSAVSVIKGVLTLIITLGLPLLVVFVAFRFIMAWFALQQGNANAYKEALQKAGNAILGFLLIVALFGGLFLVVLRYFGVKSEDGFDPLILLKLLTEAFIPYAHAQTLTTQLPNPVGANNLYDFILNVLRLVMRFFIYPALIIIWVWTGFAFVAAQGNPEGLSKAKKWLMWAFVSTLVIFMLQAFLVALRGTVEQILPGSRNQSTSQVVKSPIGTLDGRTAPTEGQDRSACTINGVSGMMSNGTCYPGRGASSNTANYCTGKRVGTLCSVPMAGGITKTGTCNNSTTGVYGCYFATQGDTCITASDTSGTIDTQGNCGVGGRTLVDIGGSCRITAECKQGLTCVSGTCQR